MLSAQQSLDFAEEIRHDIKHNRIQLPTLPEVALQVRDAVESDGTDAHKVAQIVAGDAALSARLLQVANSPLYRGRAVIDNIQMAVTRLGLKLVRSLVVSLAMKQIFQATSDALDREFRRIWEDSLQVAAISRVLAGAIPEIQSEQAMLGGLVHNIGALPILTKLDHTLGFDVDSTTIQTLIEDNAPEIGGLILSQWHFSPELAAIPVDCVNLAYEGGAVPTYSDVVLVSRLQHIAGSSHPHATADWTLIPAFAKVGIEPEIIVTDVPETAEKIAEVKDMLDG